MWGIDLIGELPKAKGGVKYAMVAIDYFTKWAEVMPLATITAKKIRDFVFNSIAKLEEKKGDWPEEMPMVLWSYNTTPRSTTGETPFMLTYGYEAMVPVEVGVGSLRRDLFVEEDAEVNQRLYLNLLDEARTNSQLKLVAYQQRIARYFNKKLKFVPFKVGDLVLRKVMPNTKLAHHGVFGANWEGPYKVKAILWKGTYRLEDLDGKPIPRA
ncbi:uncharacterized protein LOC141686107 [Apium graveolens]|uniref:uncharacterized protein LOC141686107 n=1 Tax=Apium graveolens TaxID=4045 RepID=UPI003D799D47